MTNERGNIIGEEDNNMDTWLQEDRQSEAWAILLDKGGLQLELDDIIMEELKNNY